MLKELKDFMRPEFINRVDKTIVFQPLSNDNIRQIVQLQINELNKRLEEKEIKVEPTIEALDLLSKLSYSPEYGARPVRRKLQDLVEDPLAEKILSGEFKAGDTIKIGRLSDKEELSFMKVELKVKKDSAAKKAAKV